MRVEIAAMLVALASTVAGCAATHLVYVYDLSIGIDTAQSSASRICPRNASISLA